MYSTTDFKVTSPATQPPNILKTSRKCWINTYMLTSTPTIMNVQSSFSLADTVPMAATWFWSLETGEEVERNCCKARNHRKAEGKVSGESLEQNTITAKEARQIILTSGLGSRRERRELMWAPVKSLSILSNRGATFRWCVEYFPAIYKMLPLRCCVYKEMQTKWVFRECVILADCTG